MDDPGASDNALAARLAETPAFADLTPDARVAVAGAMRPVRFAAGQSIFSQGDQGKELFLITEGRVKVSVLTAEGRELSFAHIGPGGLLGEIAMLDGGPRTADATALAETHAMSLSSARLDALIEDTPALARGLIRFLCARLRDADQQLEAVALHRIDVRLARYFLALCRQAAPGVDEGEVTIELTTSQGELGVLLGASRPKLNGALTTLEGGGAIRRSGNTVTCVIEDLALIAAVD